MKISIVLAALTGAFETDLNRASKTTQKRMKEIEKAARDAGRVIGTAMVAGATVAAVALKNAIDRADELSKSAQKIGVTTESLSQLAYAAKLADVELSALQGGLSRLTKAQNEAASGNKELISLFNALGIDFKNADGTLRATDEVFRDLARVFAILPDGADKTALALDLLGRSGANLIPLLNGGAEGLDEMASRADALGATISTGTGKASEEFNDRLSDLMIMVQGLATSVAAELLPDLLALTQAFTDGIREGGGFAEVGKTIADVLGTVAGVAFRAYKFIEFVVLGITSLIAKVVEFQATATPLGILADKLSGGQISQVAGDVGAVTGAGAGEAFDAASGISQARAVEWIDPPKAKASAEAVDDLTNRIKEHRDAQANAAAAKKAAADAAREQAKAERELQKILDEGREAFADVTEATRANAAFLAGPAAQAAKDYTDELINLVGQEEKLGAANMLTADAEAALLLARQQAQEKYQRALDEIEDKRTEQARQVLEDIQEETRLMGLSNDEREKAIALRYANADAASKEGKAIIAALEDLQKSRRIAEGLDVVRNATQGLFSDLMSGAKSAKDAFMDFVDGILDGIAQIVARNLTESLLGSFGSSGTGSAGGGLASLFGAFFGGARASGGPVYPGKAYLVGEQGPEMFIPPVAGSIATASQTRSMGGGTKVEQNITVVGSVDRRAADRLRIDAANNQRKALARSY